MRNDPVRDALAQFNAKPDDAARIDCRLSRGPRAGSPRGVVVSFGRDTYPDSSAGGNVRLFNAIVHVRALFGTSAPEQRSRCSCGLMNNYTSNCDKLNPTWLYSFDLNPIPQPPVLASQAT